MNKLIDSGLKRINDLFSAKKFDLAEKESEKLLKKFPNSSNVNYVFGVILGEKKNYTKSIFYLKQAITFDPSHVDAHYRIGVAHYFLKNFEESLISLEKVIKYESNHLLAHNLIGNIVKRKGDFADAISYYKKTISVDPNFYTGYNNLANSLAELGRFKESINYYLKAIEIKPDYADAYGNIGTIYNTLGKFDEAKNNFEKAIKINPHNFSAYRYLSMVKKYQEKDDIHFKSMKKLYVSKQINSDEKINLSFALGKACDDLKEYNSAFHYFKEGNELMRKKINYSVNSDISLFTNIKEVFSEKKLNNFKTKIKKGNNSIFIIGMPRSGSTLVEQIISNHAKVFGAGEVRNFEEICVKKFLNIDKTQFKENLLDSNKNNFDEIGDNYLKSFQENDRYQFISDKMLFNFRWVGLIKLLLPDAKIIHCKRNARDVGISIFKNIFSGNVNFAYKLEEISQYYKLYKNLMEYWEKILPKFIYNISYENLVSDKENEVRKILDFCKLEWDENCMEFHKNERPISTASANQVRQAIYNKSVKSWIKYEKHLKDFYHTLD